MINLFVNECKTLFIRIRKPTPQIILTLARGCADHLNVKLNANDADGDNLSFMIVNEPSNGQLGSIDQATNTVTYTPHENYSGEDNFTFIVNDGSIDSNEATVSILVEEEQQQQTEQAEEEEQTDEAETSQEEEVEVEEEEEGN